MSRDLGNKRYNQSCQPQCLQPHAGKIKYMNRATLYMEAASMQAAKLLLHRNKGQQIHFLT